jgi:hypothetical protein
MTATACVATAYIPMGNTLVQAAGSYLRRVRSFTQRHASAAIRTGMSDVAPTQAAVASTSCTGPPIDRATGLAPRSPTPTTVVMGEGSHRDPVAGADVPSPEPRGDDPGRDQDDEHEILRDPYDPKAERH